MRKLFFAATICLLAFSSEAQILFSYGKYQVTKQEFLKAYFKNRTVNEPADIEKYLNLYINFKLKVRAAKDEKLDTFASQKKDLENFKTQITPLYLLDEDALKILTREAFDRSQKNLRISYVFSKDTSIINKIGYNKKASLSDLYNNFKENKNVEYADAGFITVFTLPYALESILYNLPLGTLSDPYKGNDGVYIFQVTNRQDAIIDRVKTAQILIGSLPNGDNIQEFDTKHKADSIYSLLKSGADFFDLAKKISDDRTTSSAGGMMEEYGTGKYSNEFYEQVLSIKNVNDFTLPFKTNYGYHIVKLLSKKPIVSDINDEVNNSLLKQRVMQDARVQIARDKFADRAKTILGLKTVKTIDLKNLQLYTDSLLISNKKIDVPGINANAILFFIGKKSIGIKEWDKFLNDYKSSNYGKGVPSFFELYNQFVNNTAIEEYSSHLIEFNTQFKEQVKDYEDGNLLFEEMEKKVWGKAITDSIGLINYFNLNQSKYIWKKSSDVVMITCKDATTARLVKSTLDLNKDLNALRKSFLDISIDSGRFEKNQQGFVIPDIANTFIEIDAINAENNSVIIKVIKEYPDNELKTFENARGLVMADFQNEIERVWLDTLKKKYPVIINPVVLKSIQK